jgi:hypothetical protein
MLHKETIESSSLELLRKLQSAELLSDFNLAGGTSLSLQIGHRISIDLDLFIQKDFDTNEVLEYLENAFEFKLVYSSKNTLRGNLEDVNIDLISHKYPLVAEPIQLDGIRLLSISDIAAMKLNAITGNGTRSKDFVDIYFILKQYSLSELLDFYKHKYSNRNLTQVLKSLVYFDDISINDWPNLVLEKNLTLNQVKKSIISHVKQFDSKLC